MQGGPLTRQGVTPGAYRRAVSVIVADEEPPSVPAVPGACISSASAPTDAMIVVVPKPDSDQKASDEAETSPLLTEQEFATGTPAIPLAEQVKVSMMEIASARNVEALRIASNSICIIQTSILRDGKELSNTGRIVMFSFKLCLFSSRSSLRRPADAARTISLG